MSIRNLEYLFEPRSVALIGASKRPGSVGSVIARNLFGSGFDGPVLPVHPRHQSVQGVLAYPDVASLPVVPDLAIIATPPATVPGLVAELGERGTRAAIVITAGFSEMGEEGRRLQQQVLDAARPHLMRIVGPNTLGVLNPNRSLNASFAHLPPLCGGPAFVTQSGAVVTCVIDWATARGVGFSHLVALGAMADVDFGDMLDYLANDRNCTAILLYMEGIRGNARKFMSAARAASRTKPVIVVKAGRHPGSARAATSHTGALAGADDVYDTAFRRAGMLRVPSMEELFAATETLSTVSAPRGDRLLVVTNGGGIGVLAADELLSRGGTLATLSDATRKKLDAVLPPIWSRSNPVDIVGDAPPDRLATAVQIVLEHEREMDALLILNCPTAVAPALDVARKLADRLAQQRRRVPILCCFIGDETSRMARRLLRERGFAAYENINQSITAFMQLVDFRRSQRMLMETPPSVPEELAVDSAAARDVITAGGASGEERWLSEADAKAVLRAYGIETVATRVARSPAEAGQIADELGGSVALKILSPDITHKSDVGGVVLDLEGRDAVIAAAERMLEKITEARPDARIDGFTVQPMVSRRGAYELIIGMHRDSQFGAVLLFGEGGTAVELLRDRALSLPPLNMRLAMEMISRTRIYSRLQGYRDRPAANLEAVALTLLRLSQLVVDFPEIQTLDVNPLLADAQGVIALDARIKVRLDGDADRLAHLAIRPYPKELEEEVTLRDGRTMLLRPIVPEDEPALNRAFARLDPDEIRNRFLQPMRTLNHMLAARFTQLDYDREMALVLTERGIPGQTDIHAVVRISADPDNEQAEFAIIVQHDVAGQGLGRLLMERILRHARSRGIGLVWGVTLRDNRRMRALARSTGFTQSADPDDPSLVRMEIRLDEHE
ncbi:MAG TPA: bifunctional acetate--CoA ligase family protein/GNAT family N-acetyltransferase [Pseudomonadales bacterium]